MTLEQAIQKCINLSETGSKPSIRVQHKLLAQWLIEYKQIKNSNIFEAFDLACQMLSNIFGCIDSDVSDNTKRQLFTSNDKGVHKGCWASYIISKVKQKSALSNLVNNPVVFPVASNH